MDYSKVAAAEQLDDGKNDHPTSNNETDESASADDRRIRVVFLGNTLIHRAGEFGYLETELTRLMPNTDIVFRNLGWPADTVTGTARVGFGPGEEESRAWQRPDQNATGYGFAKMIRQLKRERPDVLLIAYGSNVAFQREPGLERFRMGLSKLLDTLQPSGVRIVLVSPPPREIDPAFAGNLAQQNSWLGKVAEYLGQVTRQRDLAFVDLYGSWHDVEGDFTDNGIHLNERGYRQLAQVAVRALLPQVRSDWNVRLRADGTISEATGATAYAVQMTEYGMRWKVTDTHLPTTATIADKSNSRRLYVEDLTPGTYSLDIDGRRVARGTAQQWADGVTIAVGPDHAQVETLRQTILQKNRLYFYGFRPQNKAYIHLFRRHERGHHAAEVQRFALLVREAENDIARLRVPVTRIYELVRETDYPDHEVPGEAAVASIPDELAAFNLPEGFEINLFASDPMVSKPININWDERGRMWVATSTIYPHLQPGQNPNDQILILEDVDHDGRADKRTVFADGLLVPHSVIPGNGGAYVTQSTDLLFLQDTDGDDQADERRVLLTGFGNADVHHMIHGLRWGSDGDLYFTQSIYINSIVETPWGVRTSNGSCIWRLRTETLRLEKLSQGLVNPWGHAFDPWGQSFATDGAGGSGIGYMFPGSAYDTYGYAGRQLQSMNPGRPKECGLEYLSGRHLPSDWQHTLLTNDFRANRVTRYRLTGDGSGYTSEFLGDMVTSRHRAFRPVDVKMGPDGAIYIVDWYNPIIDHGEVDFHHPLRDKRHGRIWRLTAKNSPLVQPPPLAEATVPQLLDVLRVPEQWTRDQARRVLREKGADAVLPDLKRWIQDSSHDDHDRLEALWVCQGLRSAEQPLLETCLKSADHRVRAAAVRVLSDWREQVNDTMQLLQAAVTDPHPQVRLEAVSALRSVATIEAVELAMQALDQPVDEPLDFALFRTAHELRDVWLPDFHAGRRTFDGNPQRIAFALSSAGDVTSLDSLGEMVQNGRVRGEPLVDTLAVLAALGNSRQRALAVEGMSDLPAAGVHRVLTAFVQSDRGDIPVNASRVQTFFDSEDTIARLLAIELAGRWKLASSWDSLASRVDDANVSGEERLISGQAVMAIDRQTGSKTMVAVYKSASTDDVRATAVAALASGSPEEAAGLAVNLMSSPADPRTVSLLAEALLNQKEGPRHLAAALASVQLPSQVAQLVLDKVRLSGREMPDLVTAIRQAGGLKPLANLTAAEIAGVLRSVSTHGSGRRGEAVFRRQSLQCVACHRVNGDGGQVGPDLSSLGGSARVGEILQSLLDPNATIKEGYRTTHVVTVDGRIVSGVLRQRTDQHVSIRDSKNKLHTIASEDVDEIEAGKLSVMPTGLTEVLSRDELVDLVRYLSLLGRPEEVR